MCLQISVESKYLTHKTSKTMNMDFNLFTPTKLLFGRGKLNELGNQKLPGRKALLLISSGQSVKTSGTLDRVTAQLDKAGAAYVICNNIHENPSKEVVMEAAACAKGNRRRERPLRQLCGTALGRSCGGYGHQSRRPVGLRVRWHRQGAALTASGTSHRDYRHYLRNRFGNQLLGCYLQPRDQREDRVRRPFAESRTRHCGPGTDAHRPCRVHRLSRIRRPVSQYGSND